MNRKPAVNNRHRVLQALAKAITAHGYTNTTISHVVGIAGISRRTFYEQFKEKDQAVVALYTEGSLRAHEVLVDACQPDQSWRSQLRTGLKAYIHYLLQNPFLLKTLFVEITALGAEGLQARRLAHQRMITHVLSVVNHGQAAPILSHTDAEIAVTMLLEWGLIRVEANRFAAEDWQIIPDDFLHLMQCLVRPAAPAPAAQESSGV